jgi:hypothetical protein
VQQEVFLGCSYRVIETKWTHESETAIVLQLSNFFSSVNSEKNESHFLLRATRNLIQCFRSNYMQ